MTLLRYGYTIADLQRLARLVAATTHTSTSHADRYQEAYSAIAEHLYTTTSRPDDHDLVHAGRAAVLTAMRHTLRHHGYDTNTPGAGTGDRPRYVTYWRWIGQPAPGHDDHIIDAVAVRQILPLLTAQEQAAVNALAAFDTYQAAAAALGIPYGRFCDRLARARHRFLTYWHEHEQPSRPWTSDRRDGGPDSRDPRRVMKRFRERQRYAARTKAA
ncbi:hypothetical protein [Micromonospora inyonensis]|uniref:Uncharacterized protein n=1 Tax=Micromonospora inyonensis TaxID=47866 RepID=A0A1C6RWY9_9ACTN|nr:hypothetical protein [Micromonospora inyonensis]SCL21655.1 hypothetical protein GA0074694_3102 [Micromonospora inyonensis]